MSNKDVFGEFENICSLYRLLILFPAEASSCALNVHFPLSDQTYPHQFNWTVGTIGDSAANHQGVILSARV